MSGTAFDVVHTLGNALVGRTVVTEAIGDWPGGLATVIEITPDSNAPEIVMQVRSEHGEIGVFEREWLEVVE
jgi:hypothetical protein